MTKARSRRTARAGLPNNSSCDSRRARYCMAETVSLFLGVIRWRTRIGRERLSPHVPQRLRVVAPIAPRKAVAFKATARRACRGQGFKPAFRAHIPGRSRCANASDRRRGRGECVADNDLRDEILRLEDRIDDLAEAMARSRRISQISKVAMAGGLIWVLATILGAIPFVPAAVIGALAAMIGGVVLFGSTTTTSKETLATMRAAEAQRAALIGRMQLRVVGEDAEEQHGRSRWE
jgi:hypothetical protein